MLQAMRGGRAKKFTVVGLAFLMTAFIFFYGWSSQTMRRQRDATAVAKVNGQPIYGYFIPAFRIDTGMEIFPVQLGYDQLTQYLPDDLIIDEMIKSEILAQTAEKNDLTLGVEARRAVLRAYTLSRAGLSPMADVSANDLSRIFAQLSDVYNLPPQELERFIIWRELRERAARVEIYPQARTSILELWQTYEERRTEYRLSVASFPISTHIASQEITDAEVEEHYNANLDEFSIGAQRTYDYIRVTTADLQGEIAVTDADVSAEYENNIANYTTPTRWELSQIVLGNGEDGDELPESVQEAVNRLNSGEEFSTVALQMSTDEPTRRDGGYVGRLEPALMDPRAVAVLENHQPGDITEPIELGDDAHPYWIIFKVEDMMVAEATPLSEVADDIRSRLEARRLSDMIGNALEDFEHAYDESVTLEDMAAMLNQPIETSPPIERDSTRIPGIGVIPDRWSVDLPRLEVGETLDGVVQAQSFVAIIRLASETSSSVMPLDEVSARIRRQLARTRAQEQAEADAYAVLAAAENDSDFADEHFFTTAVNQAGIAGDITFEEHLTEPFKPEADEIADVGPVPDLAQTLYYSPEDSLSGVMEVRSASGTQASGYVIWLVRDRIAPDRAEFYDNLATVRAQVLMENQNRLITEWFADAVQPSENTIVREDLAR